ncbi:phage major capsid protein [Tranquillimonas alkanivorans]|uniref:Phage major capsid protein, HK97 family n=1 Tax=Tranquillimonas alkanivorans TaxID=441119 RepID=A0A1I5PN60_9RHOB|nr:phage major capsid protein [Tranquillimonas alkanivorans]SFP35220.1 phage major capsid protein, HK97 family [Tranquillimonas alkanivorans]
MLESVKIQRRQSEIRQSLAELVAKPEPTEDETRSMDTLDKEYRANETRYRAALIAEDEERRDAKGELETRSDREWSELMGRFEMRQVALALDEGRKLDGPTAEIVEELRERGGYRGVPVPWEALEVRAGETIASGTPDPIQTRPIIDRLFPDSVASRMGAQMISIDHGEIEWPVVTQGASVGWQASETGAVGSPQAFQTTDKALAPDQTLGVQMKITRKTLKQSGSALEQAVRRDMNSAMAVEMDRVVFLGSGSSGEPLGVIAGAATYGITDTDLGAAPTWSAFRSAVVRFMLANAAGSPSAVRLMLRPEVWDAMDASYIDAGTAVTEWDRLAKNVSTIAMTTNGLATPTGTPAASKALLTTNAGGVAPIFVGKWGAVDLIRDPFTDAASGGLRITALATLDVTVARPKQLEVVSGIQ